MRILALDTSLRSISAAVSLDKGRLVERSFHHERNALQRLLPLVQEVLEESYLTPEDLDLVACTRGPGSFTGLRIGVAAARALGDSLQIPIAPVSTLQALAAQAADGSGDIVVPLIECCPGEIYAGAFAAGSGEAAAEERCLHAGDLEEWIRGLTPSGEVCILGPAAEKYAAGFQRLRLVTSVVDVLPGDVVRLARAAAERGELVDAMHFQVSYLRASQAEIRAEAARPPAGA